MQESASERILCEGIPKELKYFENTFVLHGCVKSASKVRQKCVRFDFIMQIQLFTMRQKCVRSASECVRMRQTIWRGFGVCVGPRRGFGVCVGPRRGFGVCVRSASREIRNVLGCLGGPTLK